VEATRCLREEHRLIERVLDCFEIALRASAASGEVKRAEYAPFLEFFGDFADLCHHAKEEDRLFPALEERGVGLAFDDFGRGQSRFLELAELRPEFVKFDRATIAGAREMGDSKARMIETLVEMVHAMGQSALAEGIETVEELDFCRELGFDYGQGYLLGRPRPADEPPTDDAHLRARFPSR